MGKWSVEIDVEGACVYLSNEDGEVITIPINVIPAVVQDLCRAQLQFTRELIRHIREAEDE